MNDILRFALIIGALLAVYYLVNKTTVVPNAGSVTIPALPTVQAVAPVAKAPVQLAVAPEDDAPAHEVEVESDADHLNWEGLGDSQLQGALSKQYQDLTGEDLLPHNDIAQFAEVYPNGVGQMQNKNFLHAGHHVGINTVGQALRNASHDLRSEPANPQVQVSPWQQSSYQPDLLRRPFTIGECE